MRTVFLENERVRVGVLADNGTVLSMGARERRRFSLLAEVFEGGPG